MGRFGSAVVLTAVLVFAVTAWASGSPGGKRADKGHAGHGKTIRFYAPTVQFKQIDLGDAGFSLGDESVFSDDLLTVPNGKRPDVIDKDELQEHNGTPRPVLPSQDTEKVVRKQYV